MLKVRKGKSYYVKKFAVLIMAGVLVFAACAGIYYTIYYIYGNYFVESGIDYVYESPDFDENSTYVTDKILYITEGNTDIEAAKATDEKYEDIIVVEIGNEDFNPIQLYDTDLVIVDNNMLDNENIRSFIQEWAKEHYVVFYGKTTTAKLSELYGKDLEARNTNYILNDDYTLEKNNNVWNYECDEFGALLYSEDQILGQNIGTVGYEESSNYFIVCLDFFLEDCA